MRVTFCGHKEVYDAEAVEHWLRQVCSDLIAQGADEFLCGGYGRFDYLSATVLRDLKQQHPTIRLILVLPYLNSTIITDGYDETIYPPWNLFRKSSPFQDAMNGWYSKVTLSSPIFFVTSEVRQKHYNMLAGRKRRSSYTTMTGGIRNNAGSTQMRLSDNYSYFCLSNAHICTLSIRSSKLCLLFPFYDGTDLCD